MKEKDSFTRAEIETAINNAIVFSIRPGRYPKGIPATRLATLRQVAQDLVKPLNDYLEDGPDKLLEPEELVLILLASAGYIQTAKVMGRNSLNKMTIEAREKIEAIANG